MKNKGIIYKVTHKQSGKTYIGATTNNMHQRKLDHTERAKRGEQGQFQEAIGTYGPDAFSWAQIDTASSMDELAKKEKEYIIQYDSKENGFNSDAGGGIQKTVYQFRIEDGILVGKYDCLQSAANAVGAAKTSISNTCLGQNKTCKGYFWAYSSTLPTSPINLKDQRKKHVIQLDLADNLIAEYNSVSEASKATGVSKTCISKVCRGERDKSGGFIWKYE